MNRKGAAIAVPLAAIPVFLILKRTLSNRTAAIPTADEPSTNVADVAAKNDTLRGLREALENGYASTLAAFVIQGDEAEYEATAAQAQRDADHLLQVFAGAQSDVGPELVAV